MPADEPLFTRDEALGGLPARRAATLLFLIESRSAHFEARSRLLAQEFPTEKAAQELDLEFVEAFTLSREPPMRPTIRHLERHAEKWAHLVPENPRLRAAVAHLLAEKYLFTYRAVPGIRASLGLDRPDVKKAYAGHYDRTLETIFAPGVSLIERFRWVSTDLARRLDSLPPFWTTFLLVLTLSLPQSVLALPIAAAELGLAAGVGLLIFFGLFNVVTMACMAEAFARNGSIRYGSAFTGRMVSDYVGAAGSLLLVAATATRVFIGLVACYYGLAITLANFTSVPASAWTVSLFLLAVYLLAGKSLNFSTGLSVLLGAASLSLLFILTSAALNYVQWANLSYVNVALVGGEPLDHAILQVIFGIVIQSYLGHSYLTQCAKVVLPRDPGGASLVWGTAAASVAMTLLLCGWLVAVNGALAPSLLAGHAGTVLTPLSRQIGAHVNILGFLLVTLLLGLGFIRQSTILFNLARERVPSRIPVTVVMPRRRASLLLRGRAADSPYLSLTYLGLSGALPQFRFDIQLDGKINRLQINVDKSWNVSALFERLPELRPHGISLDLEMLNAFPESATLRVNSTMHLKYEGEWGTAGLHFADVSTLRDPLRQLANWMTRQGEVSLSEVTAHVGGNEWIAQLMVDELIELGIVQPLEGIGDPRYRIHLARRHGRQLPDEVWQSLGEAAARPIRREQRLHPIALQFRKVVLGQGGRFLLSMTPVILVFLVTEWLILSGASSFTGVLAVAGLLANSLVGGIFPVLLLVSSRRKGDLVPKAVIRLLGHPAIVAAVYLLFTGTLFLHAVVIWQHPAARATAAAVGLLVLFATAAMARQGAFSRRLVVELKENGGGQGKWGGSFNVTADGKPTSADVELRYGDGEERRHETGGEFPSFGKLRSITFHLPAMKARELKVWAHKVTPDGNSEALPALVEFHCGSEIKQFDLKLSGGQVIWPITGDECRLRVTLPETEGTGAI
ncbi:MAG: hypothetical protein ACREQ2_20375 [Candidatus Binatia bacterium]